MVNEGANAGQPIRCKAAIAWEVNKPLSIETVEVAPPKKGEVRIKMMATSLCHSDATVLAGSAICRFRLNFPVILGHEGAGIVESVGEDVESVVVGDTVVPVSVAQCNECAFCKTPDTNLCMAIAESQCAGLMPDHTSRFTCRGQSVFHFVGCSTFSEYTVVPEIAVCKINPRVPFEIGGLLGCGFSTGYGSATQVAQVRSGSICAIWGLGAVGLATIIGCKRNGANRIFAIDTNPAKFELATKLGATDCVDPVQCGNIVAFLEKITNGMGCDFTFECVGTGETIRQALAAAHKGNGECVINGVLPSFQEVSIDPYLLLTGRRLRGAILGGFKLRSQVPRLAEDYLSGHLPLNDLITHHLDFDKINTAFSLLREGSIRTVMSFSA